eukprot:Skav211972  [mRNA]  locus=scaffold1330:1253:3988:+ [translate_table: standard]
MLKQRCQPEALLFDCLRWAIWVDIVEPPTLPPCLQGDESADVLVAQEQAAESKFKEIKVKLAADCQAMTNFNLEKSKRLEDKLVQHKIEIRPFVLPIDVSGLNGNREMPCGYSWSICVLDTTLPAKGTAHRAARGAVEDTSQCVVVNAILYDGALEKVCLAKKIPICSQSEKQPIFTSATKLMKLHLLDFWKRGEEPFADRQPKYKSQIEEDQLPSHPDGPNLTLCRLVDGVLVLPRDCRQEWMTDAVRAPEWRRLVQEFDRHFSTPVDAAAAVAQAVPNPEGGETAEPAAQPLRDWKALFGEPLETSAFKTQYANKIKGKFSWCPELTAHLVQPADDPEDGGLPVLQLFLEASQDYNLSCNDEAFLVYGAGSWLTDNKADQWLENAPENHRGVLLKFENDAALVENGADGDLKSLKDVIQECERKGMVDFDLAGHTYTRSAAVMQGQAADSFLGSHLLYKVLHMPTGSTKTQSCPITRVNMFLHV